VKLYPELAERFEKNKRENKFLKNLGIERVILMKNLSLLRQEACRLT
jgi:hypothetical protein